MNMKTNKRLTASRVRWTPDEARAVAELAAASGLTTSEFIRRCTLGREIHTPRTLPECSRAAYAELGRISGNLQRLYTWATGDKRLPPDFGKQLSGALVSLKRTCQDTQKQLIGGDDHDL